MDIHTSPSERRRVALTGATGIMGSATLREMLHRHGHYQIKILARDTPRNRHKMSGPLATGEVEVIWGDLTDRESVAALVRDVDIILHIGGMVSPAADRFPEECYRVNTTAMRLICEEVSKLPNADSVGVVYIGSVAQYGPRTMEECWGAVGDVMRPARFDAYAASKVEAERILASSGLKKWVSLRQTGILYPGLLEKGMDPITFHVPFEGVLEWVTAEQSGHLMEQIASMEQPDSFWRNFYNIGGGEAFRLTNYEFEKRLLQTIGCPRVEKIFDYNWFATGNFHGFWFKDSDRLEQMFHFRWDSNPDQYFSFMRRRGPWWLLFVPIVPAVVMKKVMGKVARTPGLGPMWWIENDIQDRIEASWGGKDAWEKLPQWKDAPLTTPDSRKTPEKDARQLEVEINNPVDPARWQEVARERGGEFLGQPGVAPGGASDPDVEGEWRHADGTVFRATPRHVVIGGYWYSPTAWRQMS